MVVNLKIEKEKTPRSEWCCKDPASSLHRHVHVVEKTGNLEIFSMLTYWLDLQNSICILSMLPICFCDEIFCWKFYLIWEDIKNFENYLF